MTHRYIITKPVNVGIYDAEYRASIYSDKIIVTSPYVKWVGNTGGYAERKEAIRDNSTVAAVLADMADGCDDSAWERIGRHLQDGYLSASCI